MFIFMFMFIFMLAAPIGSSSCMCDAACTAPGTAGLSNEASRVGLRTSGDRQTPAGGPHPGGAPSFNFNSRCRDLLGGRSRRNIQQRHRVRPERHAIDISELALGPGHEALLPSRISRGNRSGESVVEKRGKGSLEVSASQ